jgi:hypothetical protein
MAEFLVEMYVSRGDAEGVDSRLDRARLGAHEVTRNGMPVRCVRSIFVPEDETCFLVYEAGSEEAVQAAVSCAALPFERVTRAVAS